MRSGIWVFFLTVLFSCAGFSLCTPAGAISMDKSSSLRDMCETSIGPDPLSIVSYMPDRSRDRFCDDFPSTGRIIFTFDLIAARLRDLPIEIKIVRENDKPLDVAEILAADVLTHKEPMIYKGGVITVEHDFNEPGNFAAFITVFEPSGWQRTSRFSFRVGSVFMYYLPAMLAAIFLAGLIYVYLIHTEK